MRWPRRRSPGPDDLKKPRYTITILVVLVVLMLLGAIPAWPHSRNWGYGPSGGGADATCRGGAEQQARASYGRADRELYMAQAKSLIRVGVSSARPRTVAQIRHCYLPPIKPS